MKRETREREKKRKERRKKKKRKEREKRQKRKIEREKCTVQYSLVECCLALLLVGVKDIWLQLLISHRPKELERRRDE